MNVNESLETCDICDICNRPAWTLYVFSGYTACSQCAYSEPDEIPDWLVTLAVA